MFNETNYRSNWNWCVSTASSYMSTNWTEHFFVSEEDAKKFYNAMRKKRYAVLMVDRESY